MSDRPTAAELLETPGAVLTRSHLGQLGDGRAAIDRIFKKLDVIAFAPKTTPHVRVEDFLKLVQDHTFGPDRVR